MGILRRTRRAAYDLLDIWSYVAERNRAAADRILLSLDAAAVLLRDNPALGRARPDLAADLRSFPVKRYVLLYRAIPGGVEIVRYAHGARDLTTLAIDPERT